MTEQDQIATQRVDWSLIYDAYLAGLREGQRYPSAPESTLRKAADAHCKLIQGWMARG
jgi:hypothetical protein